MLNTETDISQEEKEKVLNNFSTKLKDSGYNRHQGDHQGGVLGYLRRVQRQGGERHRKSMETRKERQTNMLAGKTNWFKFKEKKTEERQEKEKTNRQNNKGQRETKKIETDNERQGKRQPTTVMFVPRTKGGELARRLKEKEKELSKHTLQTIRIVERNRDRLEHLLVRQDPFGEEKFGRRDYLMCATMTKDKRECRKANMLYTIE